MLLDQKIEELRTEANHCHPDERRLVMAELELVEAELAVVMAEQDGSSIPCRPSQGGHHRRCMPPGSHAGRRCIPCALVDD